jgi:hypothetical protein
MTYVERLVLKDSDQALALSDIADERERQEAMWGEQTHDPAYWLAIMGKQVGQLGDAILKYKWHDEAQSDDMYAEAKQVAAVACAIMEAILAERLSDEVTSVKPEPRKLANVLNRGDESIHSDRPSDCAPRPHRKDGTCCDVAYAARPPVAPPEPAKPLLADYPPIAAGNADPNGEN